MTRLHIGTSICLLTLAALYAPAALADSTTTAIRKAETHYRQGSLGKALTKVEEAATLVARRRAAQIATTFPAAPGGWTAKPVNSSIEGKRRAGRGVILRRAYLRNGGKGEMRAQLMVTDNPRIFSFIKDRKVAEAKRMKRTVLSIGGAGKAFLTFDKSNRMGDLFIFAGDNVYIAVFARNVESRAILIKTLSAWNFAALKKMTSAN